jgi:DNA-binding GntR family transcriptional regulator
MQSPDDGRDGVQGTVSAQARVAEELRRAIISGELAPKSQVSEAALAAEHGVSRTPIREALKQLETEGLVRIVPRVGTFVSAPSWPDIVELSQVREVIEGLAARLAAQRGDHAVVTSLGHAVENMRKAAAAGDLERAAVHGTDFHDAVVIGSGSRKLLQFYRQLMNQMTYHRLAYQQAGRTEASAEEHAAILEAIVARDADAAEYAMREHVRRGQRAAALNRLDDPRDGDPLPAGSPRLPR